MAPKSSQRAGKATAEASKKGSKKRKVTAEPPREPVAPQVEVAGHKGPKDGVPIPPLMPGGRFGLRAMTDPKHEAWYKKNVYPWYVHERCVDYKTLEEKWPNVRDSIFAVPGHKKFFCEIAEPNVNIDLVREFYAKWDESVPAGQVEVRGRLINFGKEVINNFYGFAQNDHLALLEYTKRPTYREFREQLCRPHMTAKWEKNSKGHHYQMRFSDWDKEAKIWLRIVNSAFLPFNRTTEIHRVRCCIVLWLTQRRPLNMGYIIFHFMSMAKAANNLLRYAGLITALCRRAGCPEESYDRILVNTTEPLRMDSAHDAKVAAETPYSDRDVWEAMLSGIMQGLMLKRQKKAGNHDYTIAQLDEDVPLTPMAREVAHMAPPAPQVDWRSDGDEENKGWDDLKPATIRGGRLQDYHVRPLEADEPEEEEEEGPSRAGEGSGHHE